MNFRTALEFNKHTVHLMNFSLNNPMAITAYLVKPRHCITTTELASSGVTFGGGGVSISSAATIMAALFSAINNQSSEVRTAALTALNPNTTHAIGASNTFPGQPTSATPTVDNLGIYSPGESLFNQKWFTQRFKVIKVKKFCLQPGKRAQLSIQMPHRMLTPANIGTVNTTGATPGTWSNPFVMYPHSRMWLCSFHGTPAPYVSKLDGTGVFKAFDAPASVLGMYHVEQFCIRQYPAAEYNNVAYRLTGAQDLTGALGPVSFGRVAQAGETVTAGTGGAVANICTE